MNMLKGTKTAENLMKAFAGESQARNRYTFFASIAKKEGFVQISNIFIETADNEKEHGKRFFKLLCGTDSLVKDKYGVALNGTNLEITGAFPINLQDTKTNLESAASGEHEEQSDLYPHFADVADEEGFHEIAQVFRAVCRSEEAHEKRFKKLIANIENNAVFKKDEKVIWKCGNCGYILEAFEAPEKCPACFHPKSYFELYTENY